jgi:uncharacterized protein (TIGR02466 family)
MQPEFPFSESIGLAFPTPILRQRCADAERVNDGLRRAILDKERAAPTSGRSLIGGWHSKDDLLDWPQPEIRTFRGWIGQAIQEMARFALPDAGKQGPLSVDLDGGAWANIVRHGSYHKIHNHPDCDWSGVYYVAVGAADPAGPPENGMIEFLDPRMGATAPGLRGPEALPKLRVAPEPGLMLVFPSWLYHYVNTFHGTGERISIAFNVRLRFRQG